MVDRMGDSAGLDSSFLGMTGRASGKGALLCVLRVVLEDRFVVLDGGEGIVEVVEEAAPLLVAV